MDQTTSQIGTALDGSSAQESKEDCTQEIDNVDLAIDRDAIVKEGQAFAKKKVKAVTDSLDRMGEAKP